LVAKTQNPPTIKSYSPLPLKIPPPPPPPPVALASY
jgi:hypothetical protein